MQCTRETKGNPVCAAYACYNSHVSYSIHCKLVINARVSDSFLNNNFGGFLYSAGKNIKISSSRWWRFELATSAIAIFNLLFILKYIFTLNVCFHIAYIWSWFCKINLIKQNNWKCTKMGWLHTLQKKKYLGARGAESISFKVITSQH